MPHRSDFIDRLLYQSDLLGKLWPSEPLAWDLPKRVREADDATIAGGRPIVDAAALAMVRGGLLYAVDALDPAHRIFQEEKSDLGSYWHGMMHRREADFDNARYWFRRAGRLGFFGKLHAAASEHSAVMARQSSWDPYLFTGECEQARFGATEQIPELVKLQRTEWEEVFGYCWRRAVGG